MLGNIRKNTILRNRSIENYNKEVKKRNNEIIRIRSNLRTKINQTVDLDISSCRTNSIHRKIKTRRVAIIFFGLTKDLDKNTKSLTDNLFNILKRHNIDYDIFIHSNIIDGKYENPWSKECASKYKNSDIETLLKPKIFLSDKQDDILKDVNLNEYYSTIRFWEDFKEYVWPWSNKEHSMYLIRNMYLALYSKKRIIEEFEKYKNDYSHCILMRPDLFLKSQFDLRWLDVVANNNILLPYKDCYHGVNDRICIGSPDTIIYCGKLFDYFQQYSQQKGVISEVFFKDMLIKKDITIKKINMDYEILRIT